MNEYRIHMEHLERRKLPPGDGPFLEHIEAVVNAPNAQAAVDTAKALLPDWIVRVVMAPHPDAG